MPAPESRSAPPFPTRFPCKPTLSLPRRTRAALPFSRDESTASGPVHPETERILRNFEASLAERERLLAEGLAHLADRTRDLDEMEALLRAREALIVSARLGDTHRRGVVTLREAEALHELKAELDRQEITLRESRQALREREKYLEESETRLFAKVQAQQEKETELEQREEDLATRRAAAGETPKRPYDEFCE